MCLRFSINASETFGQVAVPDAGLFTQARVDQSTGE